MSDNRALGGCITVFMGCLVVGSCMLMHPGTKPTEAKVDYTFPDDPRIKSANRQSTSSASDDADVAKAKAIVKEQFFPDQVDKSGSAKYQREWYMIKGAVQQAGFPCAAVAYVQQTMEGTFKAVCKVALHTNKYDAFTIDPDSETVEPDR